MNYVQFFFSYFSVGLVNRGLVIGLLRVGEMLPLFHIRSFGNYESEMVTRDSFTLRLLMSYIYIYIYIYGAPILDVSRSHTTTQHSR